MKTLVNLRIDQKVNSSIIKEVLSLSKINTPKPKEIEIKKDSIDDKLLLIIFESHKGKQVDLVDDIMKSYSHFLESYKDISVQFETKRNKIEIFENKELTKQNISNLILKFYKSIDKKDWNSIIECLDKKIEILSNIPRRGKGKKMDSNKYVEQITKEFTGILTKHKISSNSHFGIN